MSFLLISPSGRKVLFDAGARRDYWNYSPMIVERFRKGVNVGGMRVEKGVHDILIDSGLELDEIDAVIWRFVLP
jgi:hypothetical protein